MMHKSNRNGRGTTGRATARLAVAGVALLSTIAACSADELLTVQDEDVVRLDALTTKEALPSVRAAVIGEFQVAYAGSSGSEGIAQLAALLADEFWSAESFPTRNEIDLRQIQAVNSTLLPIYRSLHRARATAEVASSRYAELDPTNTAWAEVLALGGYTYLAFAENYCSGVPFSI
jgi:starch-binding outer membrane protein, SusD/RagB family